MIELNPLYGKAYTKLGDALAYAGASAQAAVFWEKASEFDSKGDRSQFRDKAGEL